MAFISHIARRAHPREGAVAAILCTLLGQIFLIFGIGDFLTQLSYDIPFAFRSNIQPTEALLVYMDEESHHLLKQHSRFDLWDRGLHAQLIRRLKSLGAKAVVFDILFDSPNDPATDQELIAAVRDHGNVFVAGIIGSEVFNHQVIGTKPIRPFDGLHSAVKGWGMVEVPDSDAVIREHYGGGLAVPSLNWMVATQSMGGIDSRPTRRWMNYYGPSGTLPWASYHHVISNTLAMSMVSNRVVYVGCLFSIGWAGGKGTDDFRTPYSRWDSEHRKSPGVELNATAFLNLIRNDWLRRSSPIAEVVGMTLLGTVLGFGLMHLKPVPAAAAGALFCILLSAGACFLAWEARLWIPWMIPVAVQAPVALVCCVLVHSQRLARAPAPYSDGSESLGPVAAKPMENTVLLQQEFGKMRQVHDPAANPAPVAVGHDRANTTAVPDHTLLKRVGKGAYGEVWLARTVLGGYRAAKLVFRDSFPEAQPYEREFDGIRHFEPISRNHECLVPILHVGRNDAAGHYFYLMEPADDMDTGSSIHPESYVPKTLGREITKRGSIPAEECIALGLSLSTGIQFLHEQGLLHRDIKPSNIIFIKGIPKLADIGLVTAMDESISFVGTKGYFPPEGPGTPSADVFSLGKVLYQCLTGLACARFPELPLEAQSKHGPLYGKLNEIILRACHPMPTKRFQSAKEIHSELSKLQRSGARRWF